MSIVFSQTDLTGSVGTWLTANRGSPYVTNPSYVQLFSDDSLDSSVVSGGIPLGEKTTLDWVFTALTWNTVTFRVANAQGGHALFRINGTTLEVGDDTSVKSSALVLALGSYHIRLVMGSGSAWLYITPNAPLLPGLVFRAQWGIRSTLSGVDTFSITANGTGGSPSTGRLSEVHVYDGLLFPRAFPVPSINVEGNRVGFPVKLDASASSDPGKGHLEFLWTVDSVPTGSSITVSSLEPSLGDDGEEDGAPFFVPDLPGVYGFNLRLSNEEVYVDVPILVDVRSSRVALGEHPDPTPLWSVLSDAWNRVTDRGAVHTFFESLMRMVSHDFVTMYQTARDRSLRTIRRTVARHGVWWSLWNAVTEEPMSVGNDESGVGAIPFQSGVCTATGTTVITDASATFVTRLLAPGDPVLLRGVVHQVALVLSETQLQLDRTVAAGSVAYEAGVRDELRASSTLLASRLVTINGNETRVVLSKRGNRHKLNLPVAAVGGVTWESGSWIVNSELDVISGDVGRFLARQGSVEEDHFAVVCGSTGSAVHLFSTPSLELRRLDTTWDVSLEELLHCVRFPLHERIQTIPSLQTSIVEPEEVWNQNQHYTVDGGYVVWPTPFDAVTRPPRNVWANEVNLENESVIERNFGEDVGVLRDDPVVTLGGVDYLSVVRGLYACLFMGASIDALSRGVSLLSGLPVTPVEGVIEEIDDNFSVEKGKIVVLSSTGLRRLFFYKKILGLPPSIVVGASVKAWTPLSLGVDIVDWLLEPSWWGRYGLVEAEKFFTFLVRVDVECVNNTLFLGDITPSIVRFLNQIKPIYTTFVFAWMKKVRDEIDVTEAITLLGSLHFRDRLCADSRVGLYGEVDSSGIPTWWYGGGLTYGYRERLCPEEGITLTGCITGSATPLLWGTPLFYGLGMVYGGTIPDGETCVLLLAEPPLPPPPIPS